jgi:hypothetical protein
MLARKTAKVPATLYQSGNVRTSKLSKPNSSLIAQNTSTFANLSVGDMRAVRYAAKSVAKNPIASDTTCRGVPVISGPRCKYGSSKPNKNPKRELATISAMMPTMTALACILNPITDFQFRLIVRLMLAERVFNLSQVFFGEHQQIPSISILKANLCKTLLTVYIRLNHIVYRHYIGKIVCLNDSQEEDASYGFILDFYNQAKPRHKTEHTSNGHYYYVPGFISKKMTLCQWRSNFRPPRRRDFRPLSPALKA